MAISPTQTLPALGLDTERRHRLRLAVATILAAAVIVIVAVYGFPYYRLDLPARAYSPYHRALRPSGSIGLRLGMLAFLLFCVLFLYPIRKRWKWLGGIGKTRHWLDFHVLLGITAPILVTFHSAFKLGGMAGVAYWIMMAVTLSGFVGRYLYAQIPRSLNTAELSLKEMEAVAEALARQLASQSMFARDDIVPLLKLPSRQQVQAMSVTGALIRMFYLDLTRPLLVSGLRRRCLSRAGWVFTLGGLLPSGNVELETIITNIRR